MAVVLGVGDTFHLVPRIISLATNGFEEHIFSLGLGKLITSVTMTIFYLILYHIWRERYDILGKKELTVFAWALSLIRILLCLMPQNEWFTAVQPLSWGIYRNIPFSILGLLIIVIFYQSAKETNDRHFKFLWLAVVLSFGFYIPVVLFVDTIPLIGMLMIPKTCAYIWIVMIGYYALKGE